MIQDYLKYISRSVKIGIPKTGSQIHPCFTVILILLHSLQILYNLHLISTQQHDFRTKISRLQFFQIWILFWRFLCDYTSFVIWTMTWSSNLLNRLRKDILWTESDILNDHKHTSAVSPSEHLYQGLRLQNHLNLTFSLKLVTSDNDKQLSIHSRDSATNKIMHSETI